MGFSVVAAIIASAILLHMIGFQLLLALGFPLGKAAWGGKYIVLPNRLRLASLFSTLILLYAALAILEKSGMVEVINSANLVASSVWLFAIFFFINTVANALSTSRVEKLVMTPLALLCSTLFFVVATA